MRRLTTALAIVSLGIQCVLLVLGLLVMVQAHPVTAAADGPAHVTETCGAGPAVLEGGTRTLGVSSLQPPSSPGSNSEAGLFHTQAYSPSALERSCLSIGNCHQSKLHCFVHVFLF
jgi:hypothetical protein